MKWFYLIVAIIGELIATSALKESKGFSILKPSIISVIGYEVTFYFLSLAIKQIPLGIAYAVWVGMGIILITIISYFRFKQTFDSLAHAKRAAKNAINLYNEVRLHLSLEYRTPNMVYKLTA